MPIQALLRAMHKEIYKKLEISDNTFEVLL